MFYEDTNYEFEELEFDFNLNDIYEKMPEIEYRQMKGGRRYG